MGRKEKGTKRPGTMFEKHPSTPLILRPGGDGGLAGGLDGFGGLGGDAATLVRQRALTVRIDTGVRALFDGGAVRFMETLDAATHGSRKEGKGTRERAKKHISPPGGNAKVRGGSKGP